VIRVNDKWDLGWQPRMSVDDVLVQCKFSHRHIVVAINGVVVPSGEYVSRLVEDGDQVRVIHVIGGG
jgi:sulfur carrier protein